MASDACDGAVFTTFLTGFSQAINWKPTEFVNDLRGTRSCTLCGAIPNEILLLDCCHTFCRTCYESFRAEGQACPLDGDHFDDAQVVNLEFSESRLLNRQVRCWNRQHGCGFEGPLGDTLRHFQKQCQCHPVTCFRCNAVVLQKEMLHHYRHVCVRRASKGSFATSGFTDDVLKTGKVIEDKLTTLMDAQASLQDRLNSLTAATCRVLESVESTVPRLEAQFGRIEEGIRTAEDSITTSNAQELAEFRQHCERFFRGSTSSSKEVQATLERVPGLFRHRNWLKSLSSSVFTVSANQFCWAVEHVGHHVGRAVENGGVVLLSDPFTALGYNVRMGMKLAKAAVDVDIGVHLTICRGPTDVVLEWPFTVPFTLSLIHPKDSTKNLRRRVNPRDENLRQCFQRPAGPQNIGAGVKMARRRVLSDFILNDALLASVEFER